VKRKKGQNNNIIEFGKTPVIYTCEAGKWVRFVTRILSAEEEKGVRATNAKSKNKTTKI